MEPTNFELFKSQAKANVEAFQATARIDGIWTLAGDLKVLTQFQNNMNLRLMCYLFGEDLGMHHWEKYYKWSSENVLVWMQRLDDEARVYILHELKTNDTLFAHS